MSFRFGSDAAWAGNSSVQIPCAMPGRHDVRSAEHHVDIQPLGVLLRLQLAGQARAPGAFVNTKAGHHVWLGPPIRLEALLRQRQRAAHIHDADREGRFRFGDLAQTTRPAIPIAAPAKTVRRPISAIRVPYPCRTGLARRLDRCPMVAIPSKMRQGPRRCELGRSALNDLEWHSHPARCLPPSEPRSKRQRAATWPISAPSTLTVVMAGYIARPISRSPNPHTASRSGTEMLRDAASIKAHRRPPRRRSRTGPPAPCRLAA